MPVTKKERIFNFFKENPEALYNDKDINKYSELLGVKKSTYKKNRIEFRSLVQAQNCTETNYKITSRCEKREKFVFDDSKLFEISCR